MTDTPPVPFGHGGGMVSYHQIRALARMGQLEAVFSAGGPVKTAEILNLAVPVVDITPEKRRMASGPWALDYLTAIEMRKYPEATGIFYSGSGFPISAELARRKGMKTISYLSAHNIDVSREEFKRFGFDFPMDNIIEVGMLEDYMRHYHFADLILIPSTASTKYVTERLGFPKDNIRTVPLGCDLPPEAPPLRTDKVRALHVSQLGLDKGQAYLLSAWWKAPQDAELSIAGAGTAGIPGLMRDLPPRVRYLGAVDQLTLVNLYTDCNLYLHSSVSEGYGLTVGEAMAFGRPAIVTEGTGAADMVREGGGRIVPIRDPKAMVAAIAEITADENEWRRLGAEAREVAGRYTWAIMEDRIMEAIGEIL